MKLTPKISYKTRSTSLNQFVLFTAFILLTIACERKEKGTKEPAVSSTDSVHQTIDTLTMPVSIPKLDISEANRLSKLPLICMDTEFPNKLNQTLATEADLQTPSALHPAFYGCFDWHSAVHGHWSLVSLLKQFPDLEEGDSIRQKLAERISKENILKEILYFQKQQNKSFERTYGWAWLLKLAEELHTWDDSLGQALEKNLQPLTDIIVNNYITFLPKLYYPIRVGTHTNTGFGLGFAYDYANTVGHEELKTVITKRAKAFFMKDSNGPFEWEPGGYDFLSPCLEEADIMRRVLPKAAFATWLKQFLPQLSDKNFQLVPGIVSDREDGHLVHLDGVNFSRAWCLYGIAKALPEYAHLNNIAHDHINHSLPTITDGHYEGSHWLASFAIYALNSM